MTCPYLAYRRDAPGSDCGDTSADDDADIDADADAPRDERDGGATPRFDVERAFCTVVEEFVQPMRADVCNDRYDLSHASHCEYYREAEGLE
jgi:hypothetical protein